MSGKSLNTYQNAVYAKEVAAPAAGERWLVVTSAFHMPRTMGVFRAVGFDVVALPRRLSDGRGDVDVAAVCVL